MTYLSMTANCGQQNDSSQTSEHLYRTVKRMEEKEAGEKRGKPGQNDSIVKSKYGD